MDEWSFYGMVSKNIFLLCCILFGPPVMYCSIVEGPEDRKERQRSISNRDSERKLRSKEKKRREREKMDRYEERKRERRDLPFSHRVSFREEIEFVLSVNQVVRKTNSLASQKDIFLRHLNRRTFIYFRGPTNQKIEDTLRFSSKSWMTAAWSNDCCSWHGGKKKQKRRRYRIGIRKNDFGHVTDFGERGETRKQK